MDASEQNRETMTPAVERKCYGLGAAIIIVVVGGLVLRAAFGSLTAEASPTPEAKKLCEQAAEQAAAVSARVLLCGSQNITRGEFGDAWPFTVERGILECLMVTLPGGERRSRALRFTSAGQTWAINGTAAMLKLGRPINKLPSIWARDPRWTPGLPMMKNLSPIFDLGLALCAS